MSRIYQPYSSCAASQPHIWLTFNSTSSVTWRQNFNSQIRCTGVITLWRTEARIVCDKRNVRAEYRIGIAFKFKACFGANSAKLVGSYVLGQNYSEIHSHLPVLILRKRHREEFPFYKFVTM